MHLLNQSWAGGGNRWVPETHYPGSLAKFTTSGSLRNFVSKNKVESYTGRHQMSTYIQICIYHTERQEREIGRSVGFSCGQGEITEVWGAVRFLS